MSQVGSERREAAVRLSDLERLKAIEEHGGSVTRAAAALGIDYSGLLRFAKKKGVYKRYVDPLRLSQNRRRKLIAGARLILEALEDTAYEGQTERRGEAETAVKSSRYIYKCLTCKARFAAIVRDPYEEDPDCPNCGEGVATQPSTNIDEAGVLPLGRI